MTREEKVKNLLTELIDMIDNGSQRDLDRADEISKIIIKALSQEPTAEKSVQDMTELEKALLHIKTRADAWAVKVVKDALESCTDAVSRDAVKELIKSGVSTDTYDDVEQVCKWIDALPSVTQKSDKYRKEAKRWKNKWLKSQKSRKWLDTNTQ